MGRPGLRSRLDAEWVCLQGISTKSHMGEEVQRKKRKKIVLVFKFKHN